MVKKGKMINKYDLDKIAEGSTVLQAAFMQWYADEDKIISDLEIMQMFGFAMHEILLERKESDEE